MWSASAVRKPLRLTAQRLHDMTLSAWNTTHGPVEQDTDERVLDVVHLSYYGSYASGQRPPSGKWIRGLRRRRCIERVSLLRPLHACRMAICLSSIGLPTYLHSIEPFGMVNTGRIGGGLGFLHPKPVYPSSGTGTVSV